MKKRIGIIFVCLAGLILSGCQHSQIINDSNQSANNEHYKFFPIRPLGDVIWNYDGLTNIEKLKHLPNESMMISTTTYDGAVALTAPFVTTSVKGKDYTVTIDYGKFRTEPIAIDNGSPIQLNIGVGLRMTARFKSLQNEINLSGLYGIGIAAQEGKIKGSLSIETIGLSGNGITPFIPIPSDLSIASIQSAVQAIAAMKAKLYTDEVDITPQIFSIDTILDKVNAERFLGLYADVNDI